jgi:hypothetical protein
MKGFVFFIKIKICLLALFILILLTGWSQSTSYSPPSCVIYDNMTLTICPPDSLPTPPIQLLHYNIYVDDIYLDNIPITIPYDTVVYLFQESQLMPGESIFCVKAVYSNWISDPACDTGLVIYGYSLPFTEDWSTGEFGTNSWSTQGSNWEVVGDTGNPEPSAVFYGLPGLENYSTTLESYYLIRDFSPLNDSYVYFDLKLESLNSSGTEKLRLEVWDWSANNWIYWYSYTNGEGSFDWKTLKRKINDLGTVFKIRFLAFGTNSSNIEGWYIDNIKVVRECDSPTELQVELIYPEAFRKLQWNMPIGVFYGEWMKWDDAQNFTSIGTGSAAEFDVAVKWSPGQYYNCDILIDQIRFFPAEENAEYTICIWQGDPPELVFEYPYPYPEVGEWNTLDIEEYYPVNTSLDILIGYHVSTTAGYPAGVDDGPAVDGKGNLMFFNGSWSTLLEINPELDYNWNIEAFFFCCLPIINFFSHNNIYRAEVSTMNFELIDQTNHLWSYVDENIDHEDYYCYKISSVWISGTDTCESPYSNDACDTLYLLNSEIRAETVALSPNPASEYVKISIQSAILHLEMYNSFGKLVLENGFFEKELIIPLINLPSGIYVIKIQAINSILFKKLLIIH